jgi:sulfite reductase alpha subunit
MHGSTGDIILLGTTTPNLQPCVDELDKIGFDLGGSGGALRSLSSCVGMARCEKACIDSMDIIRDLTQQYQAEIHRPAWPYKFKIKSSGCPNDCAAASARSDLAVIGVWRDSIRIDNAAVSKMVDGGKCPSEALNYDLAKKELTVSAEDCVHCMNCINMMPHAISTGRERGATLLIGGKATVVKGSMIGWILVPFMKMEPPYTEFKELFEKITEWWAEHAKNRERCGELIDRLGYAHFLDAVGLKPLPQMVRAPRSNPYIFWKKEEVK